MKFEGIPQVNDEDIFTGVELLLYFLGRDPSDGQPVKEPSPAEIFRQDESKDAEGNDQAHPRTRSQGMSRKTLMEFMTELVSETREQKNPRECPDPVQKQEIRQAHAGGTGKGCTKSSQARNKPRHENGA